MESKELSFRAVSYPSRVLARHSESKVSALPEPTQLTAAAAMELTVSSSTDTDLICIPESEVLVASEEHNTETQYDGILGLANTETATAVEFGTVTPPTQHTAEPTAQQQTENPNIQTENHTVIKLCRLV